MLFQKKSIHKILCWNLKKKCQKGFGEKELCCVKKILSPKNFDPKKFKEIEDVVFQKNLGKRIFGPKISWSKRISSPKNFFVCHGGIPIQDIILFAVVLL